MQAGGAMLPVTGEQLLLTRLLLLSGDFAQMIQQAQPIMIGFPWDISNSILIQWGYQSAYTKNYQLNIAYSSHYSIVLMPYWANNESSVRCLLKDSMTLTNFTLTDSQSSYWIAIGY